ncbi:MAG: leucine-rich repeat domain-containing protein, partial [Planctomycetes bacterium]|nr:leucine-rich repeat domain-containing protein [Planctomycetota bacterium]
VLSHTKLTAAGLVHLKGLGKLVNLHLGGRRNIVPGLVHLREISTLRYLSLASTKITDDDLAKLDVLKQLSGLDLYDTKITVPGIRRHLKGMKNLRSLWLQATKFLGSELGPVKAAMPNCKILRR